MDNLYEVECLDCGVRFFTKDEEKTVECDCCDGGKFGLKIKNLMDNIKQTETQKANVIALEELQQGEIQHFLLELSRSQRKDLANYLATLDAIDALNTDDFCVLNLMADDFDSKQHIIQLSANTDGEEILYSIARNYLEKVVRSVGYE